MVSVLRVEEEEEGTRSARLARSRTHRTPVRIARCAVCRCQARKSLRPSLCGAQPFFAFLDELTVAKTPRPCPPRTCIHFVHSLICTRARQVVYLYSERMLGRIFAACRRCGRASRHSWWFDKGTVSQHGRKGKRREIPIRFKERRTVEHAVAVARAGPLLVSKDVAADRLLLLLDQVDVGEHAVRLEPLGEFRCRMEER
jgi:hypothetical protein